MITTAADKDLESVPARSVPRARIYGSLLIGLSICAFLFVLRFHTVVYAHELDVDESQMLSQGMKFIVDPVPWRSVDGTSGGPLNSYLISMLLLLGFSPSYALAHLLATFLICLQIFIACRTLLQFDPGKTAILGILPLVYFYGFTDNYNYLHYSSELLPVVLIAAGFHLFVLWLRDRPERSQRHSLWLLFSIGLALGAVPWCKLQGTPIASALAVCVLLAAATRRSAFYPSPPILQPLIFCLGALLPAAVILGMVARAGVIRDFWYSYILGNLVYAGHFDPYRAFEHLKLVLAQREIQPLNILFVLAILLFGICAFRKKEGAFQWKGFWVRGTLVLWLGAAAFSVVRPFFLWDHYTIFLLLPITYLSSTIIVEAWKGERHRRRLDYFLFALYLSFVLLFVAAAQQTMIPAVQVGWKDPNQEIAAVVQRLKSTHQIRSMAIWGWTPGVYVSARIPPATRDAIGHFIVTPGPMQGYFRHRFVCDLSKAKPDLFIDSVAAGVFTWTWTRSDGYERDDELREFIDRNYVLSDRLFLVPGGKPVRFFVRR